MQKVRSKIFKLCSGRICLNISIKPIFKPVNFMRYTWITINKNLNKNTEILYKYLINNLELLNYIMNYYFFKIFIRYKIRIFFLLKNAT